ncbi:hypothetical protein [Mesorhizobium sp. BR1-1-14]|uniref:hypothetical protein n=1 Tax=Mesorhizobium sp. BR1-1-14 TaxID=2876655 RepID=UPI001CD09C2F|nr:hypothetical protein [Mesorhizobium sp. BR1-1-14]MBZ9959317.1 hypothetical protein [Mesorhizobium sp. BR1-1-14]
MRRLERKRTWIVIGLINSLVGITTSSAAPEYTILEHGLECEQKIGPIPAFSCLDGEIIPITLNGNPIINHVPLQKCDRPPLLGLGMSATEGQCVPFSRIGTLPGKNAQGQEDPNIQWAFICRRYKIRVDPNFPNFEDVAIIGHNKATGATCFFQTLRYGGAEDGIKTTRVPPPAERPDATPGGEIKAADFWYSPQETANIRCNRCHDSDAFIHTPHVDQVKRVVGGHDIPIVPPGPNLKANPPEASRYNFVGEPFQAWPAPVRIQPLGNACTSCHNIGSLTTCDRFTSAATGSPTTGISDLFQTWPHSHWMPPDIEATGMTENDWAADFAASAQKLIACCHDVSDPSCRRRAFDN